MMIKEILEKLTRKENLKTEEAYQVMDLIMKGEMNEVEIAAYLVALRCKGETVEEILGSCQAIRQHSVKISPTRGPLVDTCGTGGDARGSFNVSTVSAFVAAGAGAVVAKHGNRAVSGKCGSADLCEALGVKLDLTSENVELCLNTIGIAFLYAPMMHPAMANALPARKKLGMRTIFNLLGPLNNPAGARRQLLGVYDEELTEKMAAVLASLGSEHAMIVAGKDGLDEITLTAETKISELREGKIFTYYLAPEDFGLKRVSMDKLRSEGPAESLRICLEILNGKDGPCRDMVLLNSGAVLYVAGIASDLREGIQLAKTSIDSGAALAKLKVLVEFASNGEKKFFFEGGKAYAEKNCSL